MIIHPANEEFETTIRKMIASLEKLLANPPRLAYAPDGSYEVFHIGAYADNALIEAGARDDTVDQDVPYAIDHRHADTWENIVEAIEQHLDTRTIETMTQGFFVIRSDYA